jgi:hypothetical protein
MSDESTPTPAPTPTPTPAPAASSAAAAAPDHAAALTALEAEATDLLHRIGATVTTEDKFASRELSLAKTKLEEFVQWVEAHFKKAAAK